MTSASRPVERFGAAGTGQKLVLEGQGYVGLPLAMRAVARGYRVIGHDVDERRIKTLMSGHSFVEDVSDADLQEALDSDRYLPTTEARDCAGFDLAVITVPTPLEDGAPDLSCIRQAARMLSRFLQPGATVVLESTTYPGTTEEVVAPILEEGSGLRAGPDFHLGYSPERIDPGNRANPFQTTPKVVSGIDPESLEATDALYRALVDRTVPVSSPKVAELTKLLENTFRHVNIALVNELAMFASDLEIDLWEAIDAASTKPFGYMRFTPGPGVGGHCLPIDPSYLSWRVMRSLGRSFRFVALANDINSHMPDYVVTRISHALNCRRTAVNGARVLLLGLSYKANMGDEREAPAAVVAQRLLAQGATVHACDTHVVETHLDGQVQRVKLTSEEVCSADIVVILTDHDDFDYEMVVEEARAVLDTRHRVYGPNVEHL